MAGKQFVATSVRCPQCKTTFSLTSEEAEAFSGKKLATRLQQRSISDSCLCGPDGTPDFG
jgi:phage FluMu protein Com